MCGLLYDDDYSDQPAIHDTSLVLLIPPGIQNDTGWQNFAPREKSYHMTSKKYKYFKKKDKYNQSTCPICLYLYKKTEKVYVYECGHIYHKKCHSNSIRSCPICRY